MFLDESSTAEERWFFSMSRESRFDKEHDRGQVGPKREGYLQKMQQHSRKLQPQLLASGSCSCKGDTISDNMLWDVHIGRNTIVIISCAGAGTGSDILDPTIILSLMQSKVQPVHQHDLQDCSDCIAICSMFESNCRPWSSRHLMSLSQCVRKWETFALHKPNATHVVYTHVLYNLITCQKAKAWYSES